MPGGPSGPPGSGPNESARPPSQRSRCACAAAGSCARSSSAASRACSIKAASRSRSAKRSNGTPRLARAQEFARSADHEVLARDLEPVGVLEDHLEAQLRDFAQRLLEQQHAGALCRAPPDAAAQLVQLREAEALRVLDHHDRRVGHVDADFDDGGRDQHVHVPGDERRHRRRLLVRLHPAVQQCHPLLRAGQSSTRRATRPPSAARASPIPRSAGTPSKPAGLHRRLCRSSARSRPGASG